MRSSSKVLNKQFVIEPYHWAVYLAVGEEELEYFANKHTLDFAGEGKNTLGAAGLCYLMEDTDGCAFTLIYLCEEFTIEHVAHECTHSTQYMLEDRGVPMEVSNTEAVAYPLGYLTELIWNEANRRLATFKKDTKKGA